MKQIIINDERRMSQSSVVIGYLDEHKMEKIQFVIPEKYKNMGKLACFSAEGKKFAKLFDDITGDTITLTREITKYNELNMSIEFFEIYNTEMEKGSNRLSAKLTAILNGQYQFTDDEIVARTSILHIIINDSVVCDEIVETDEKVIILDNLINEVQKAIDATNYQNIFGYNSEKTQVLKNINGILQWVDE